MNVCDNGVSASSVDWVYHGELLALAHDLGSRLLPAFDTPTGIPYGSINLRHGVHPAESTITSLATPGESFYMYTHISSHIPTGTLMIEFGVLSRLTKDWRFDRAARKALRATWSRRSALGQFSYETTILICGMTSAGLLGNHIDVLRGDWVYSESGIGSQMDSYYEYLLKSFGL